MELAKMTLLDKLKALPTGTVLPADKIIRILKQVLTGIQEVHDSGLTHRDIKAENILVMDDEITLKLCDFGSASLDSIEPSGCSSAKLQRYE